MRRDVRSALTCTSNVLISGAALQSSYRCLIVVAQRVPGIAVNESSMIQVPGRYMVVVTQSQQRLFFVCIKTEQVTRSHFTEQDANDEAARLADVPVTSICCLEKSGCAVKEVTPVPSRSASLIDGLFVFWPDSVGR